MTTTTTTPPHYGCDAAYDGPPPHQLLKMDLRGLYRRESIDLRTGDLVRDELGRLCHDEAIWTTRLHLTYVAKGYRLVRLVD